MAAAIHQSPAAGSLRAQDRACFDALFYGSGLPRRVCKIVTEEQIEATVPSWRGCTIELAAVAEDLKEYDALRPRQ